MDTQNREKIERLTHELGELRTTNSSWMDLKTSKSSSSREEQHFETTLTTEQKLKMLTLEELEMDKDILIKEKEDLELALASRNKKIEETESENIRLKREMKEIIEKCHSLEKKEKSQETLFSYLQKQVKGIRRRVDETQNLYDKQKDNVLKIQSRHKEMSQQIRSYDDHSKQALQHMEKKDLKIREYETRIEKSEMEMNKLKQQLTLVQVQLEESQLRNSALEKKNNEILDNRNKDMDDLNRAVGSIQKQLEVIQKQEDTISSLEQQVKELSRTENHPPMILEDNNDIKDQYSQVQAELEVRLCQLKDVEEKYRTLLNQHDILSQENGMLKKELLDTRTSLRNEIHSLQEEVQDLKKSHIPETSTQPVSITDSNSQPNLQTKFTKFSLEDDDLIAILDDTPIPTEISSAKKVESPKKKESIVQHKKELSIQLKKLKCCKEPPYGLVVACQKCRHQYHAPCVGYDQLSPKSKKYICSQCKSKGTKTDRSTSAKRKRKATPKLALIK